MGGGGGTQSWDPGPRHGLGVHSIHKTKILQNPCPNAHRVATIRKEVLKPPPPKKGYPGTGGGGVAGVKFQKMIGGSFLVLK